VTETAIPVGDALKAEIKRLCREKNAVILAHYYQDFEIQDVADHVGDSLDLSRRAQATDADIIVFCGVRFMAEVAKILNPSRSVVLPDMEAGCSLEDSCQPEDFNRFIADHPDHLVVSYINCSAAVKALSDIIVTSSNAEAILDPLPRDQKIIFAPDKHLGAYLNKKTGRDMVLWDGACVVHEEFSAPALIQAKAADKAARVAAHPECPEDILELADFVGSTRKIINYAPGDFPQGLSPLFIGGPFPLVLSRAGRRKGKFNIVSGGFKHLSKDLLCGRIHHRDRLPALFEFPPYII